MESILTSIKKLSGIDETCDGFDLQIITYINAIFSILKKVGVGPDEGFIIEDESATWDAYLPVDDENFHDVKIYISSRVRKMFDPPSNTTLMKALDETINELEWRMNITAENSEIE